MVTDYEIGPDLSHWQGSAVDFAAIARSGAAFVILKATDGTGGIDQQFAANRAKAHAAGLLVGLYHFAEAGDPAAEADHFCNVAGTVRADEWIIADEERYSANPPAWLSAYIDRASAHTGLVPVTYLNQWARDQWDWSSVVARGSDLWLAKYDGVYSDKPGGSGRWPRVAMEQYTDKGTIPGVPGLCDMNVFYGTRSDLAGLGRPKEVADVPLTDAEMDKIADKVAEKVWAYSLKETLAVPTRASRVLVDGRQAASQAMKNTTVKP